MVGCPLTNGSGYAEHVDRDTIGLAHDDRVQLKFDECRVASRICGNGFDGLGEEICADWGQAPESLEKRGGS